MVTARAADDEPERLGRVTGEVVEMPALFFRQGDFGGDIGGADESLPIADHFNAPYPATKAEAEKLVAAAKADWRQRIKDKKYFSFIPDGQKVPSKIR